MANYLYNGVELPDINTVWTDKETYPYAVISDAPGFADSGFGFQLMISSSPTEINSSGSRYHVSNAVAKRYALLVHSEELDAALAESDVTAEELAAMYGMGVDAWNLVNEYDSFEAEFPIDSNPTRWANHDILTADDTVYLAASDPVPVGGKFTLHYPSFLKGVEVGRRLKNKRLAPVAYLYNGVKLPPLPDYNKKAYPYAYITKTTILNTTKYTLTLRRSMFTASNDAFTAGNWELLGYGNYLTATINPRTQTEWSELELNTPSFVTGTVEVNGETMPYTARIATYDKNSFVWINHSFNGPNGEEWITASEPVLFYE